MATLIIIRGNSGSGKTTLAKQLQAHFDTDNCLLLQQDLLRRDLLHASDHPGTPAVDLIETLLKFGLQHYSIVILEGILRKDVYGEMLQRFPALVYYLDVPFEVTVEHNQQKDQPFSNDLLKRWWLEHDYLSTNDHLLKAVGTTKMLQQIIADMKKK